MKVDQINIRSQRFEEHQKCNSNWSKLFLRFCFTGQDGELRYQLKVVVSDDVVLLSNSIFIVCISASVRTVFQSKYRYDTIKNIERA